MKRLTRLTLMAALVLGAACGGEPSRGEQPAGAAVDEYRQFVATEVHAVEDPAVVAEGLRRLAGALGERSAGSPDLWVDLRVAAEHVLLNPAEPDTTEAVRSALRGAGEALGADGLSAAAESIAPDQPLQTQADAIARCFREAAAALDR